MSDREFQAGDVVKFEHEFYVEDLDEYRDYDLEGTVVTIAKYDGMNSYDVMIAIHDCPEEVVYETFDHPHGDDELRCVWAHFTMVELKYDFLEYDPKQQADAPDDI